ncbi:MAG: ATP-binding protein [Candidatus Hodarchaeota archaeon]
MILPRGSKSSAGGQNAQKGFMYQNSITTYHLFELLIGADRVWQVTTETAEPVDDILVERRDAPNSYYQVKCYEGGAEWTVPRLRSLGVLDAFIEQFKKCRGKCRLILSSPIPPGRVHRYAERARESASLEEFHIYVSQDQDASVWTQLINHLGKDDLTYSFLCTYYEEQWPSSPEDIQHMCMGRYQRSPYASIDGIWQNLRDIAVREGIRGKPLCRTELLELLRDRLPTSRADEFRPADIRLARYTARPAWYVHRDEEFDLLSATYDLLLSKPKNVLVMGDGGTGKSSFFAWMCRELEKDKRINVVDIIAEGGDPLNLVDAMSAALKAILNEREPPAGRTRSRIDRLKWYIQEVKKASAFVVLAVDHFESFFSSIFASKSRDKIAQARYSIFEAITRTLDCDNLMWVLFARSEYFFMMFPNEESLRALNTCWVRLGEFSLSQAEKLLGRLSGLAELELSGDAKRIFLENSPKNPLKMVLTFINLCSSVKASNVTSKTILRLQPWEDVFQQDFNSLEEIESSVVYAIASLMASTSRRMFALEEIHANIAIDENASISKEYLKDVLHGIQDTKRLLQQPIPGKYALYHENFAVYVISRYGGRVRTPESLDQFQNFMAMFMHQTKMPLQAIQGELNLLSIAQRPIIDKEVRNKALNRLRNLLDLYWNQIRTAEFFALRGQRKVEDIIAKEEFSPARVVIRVATQYKQLATQERIRIRLDVPSSSIMVEGDEGMLATALSNVIDNAIKYSERRREVVIKTHELVTQFIIEVSNVGIGIPPEELDRLFEPYYRGKAYATRRFVAGSGIGLYVTKDILESMGGNIDIISKPLRDVRGGERWFLSLVTVILRLPKARIRKRNT